MFPILAIGQVRSESDLKDRFQTYSSKAVQEKIFVHLDRSSYIAGESLWVKIYVVNGKSHQLLNLSKVAYLEVLDRENSPVLQAKIALEAGKGAGSVTLATSLSTGVYKVRAYTNWMKNTDPGFFFETSVNIINPFVRPEYPSETQRVRSLDLQFFPEGGNLIGNQPAVIAFRGINDQGKGVAFDGVLLNAKNDTMLHFKPKKFGIGRFSFTPAAGEKYRTVIIDTLGVAYPFDFPVVHPQGWSMGVKAAGQKLEVSLAGMQEGGSGSEVYVMAHSRTANPIIVKSALVNGKATVSLDKEKLTDGITHLTVFDASMRPVAERLWFKRPSRTMSLKVGADKGFYNVREKVTLDIAALQGTLGVADAELSLSVFLQDDLPKQYQPHIDSYLLLSSDLSGTVESPDYYFGTEDETEISVDNLMLTHGWRRFKWDDVLKNDNVFPVFPPEFGGHFVTGRVTDRYTGKPAAHVPVFMASPDRKIQLFVSESDEKGKVRFETKNFWGMHDIVVSADTRADSSLTIEIDSPFYNRYTKWSNKELLPKAAWANDLEDRSMAMQVQNSFNLRNSPVTDSDSSTFYGKPDKQYILDNYTRFPTMEEVMKEYIPGVLVRRRKGKFMFKVAENIKPNRIFEQDPLILLDGVPVFDTDKIIAFDPLKVKKIDVIEGEYYLGSLLFQGIVSYSTFTADMAGFEIDPLANILPYNGIQRPREFYSPKYNSPAALESRLPDFRSLLLWSPSINTAADGKRSITFFTSDLEGSLQVVVQGVAPSGQPGYGSTVIRVGKQE